MKTKKGLKPLKFRLNAIKKELELLTINLYA